MLLTADKIHILSNLRTFSLEFLVGVNILELWKLCLHSLVNIPLQCTLENNEADL